MVAGVGARIGTRIVQQLVKSQRGRIKNYLTQEYGQFIGGAAGVAISIGVGDYYGALTGITGNYGNEPPDKRNPPFGYLEGDALNGPTNGSFSKTLRPNQFINNNRKRKIRHRVGACACVPIRRRRRTRRR